MKPLALAHLLALALCGLLVGSCASTSPGKQRSEKTVANADKLRDQLTRLATDLGAASTALAGLQESVGTKGFFDREKVATGDIEAAYKTYRGALGDVRSSSQKASKANETLKASMAAYVQAWEADLAEVQSESLRAASMKRRAKAQERFDEVAKRFGETWQGVEAHVKNLDEIGIALGADLTPAGIAAIDGELDAAQKNGTTVQQELTKASEFLDEFARSLHSTAPETAPAAGS